MKNTTGEMKGIAQQSYHDAAEYGLGYPEVKASFPFVSVSI